MNSRQRSSNWVRTSAPARSRFTNFPSFAAYVPNVPGAMPERSRNASISRRSSSRRAMNQTITGNDPDNQAANFATDEMLAGVGLLPKMSDPPRLSPYATPLVREIYRRMVAAGLNPFSLAQRTGRGESYYRDLFRGKSRSPNLEYLPAIAEALGCKEEDLLRPGKADSQPSPSDEVDQTNEIALLGLWRVLTGQGKRRVMEVLLREATQILRDRERD